MMTSSRFHFSLVLLMNTCFVVTTSRSTQMLGQKGGHQNLTLSVNELLEFRFSFTDEVNDSHNIVVHVMHQRGGVETFDTKCIIRQSRENCTSSAEMCRCLWEPFGSYILHKIVTKEDSGTWTFKLWNAQPEVFKMLHINVEVENKTELASGTMKDDAKSTLSTVTILIISIFAVATVMISSYLVIRFLVKPLQHDRMTTYAPPSQATVPVTPPLSAAVSLELTPAAPSVSATISPAPVPVTPPLSAILSSEATSDAAPVSTTESQEPEPEAPPLLVAVSPAPVPVTPPVTAILSPEPTPEAAPIPTTVSPTPAPVAPLTVTKSGEPALSLLLTEALTSAPPTSASAPVAPKLPAQPALAQAPASSLATTPVPEPVPLATILTNKPLPPPKPSTGHH
ncbi:calphotin-like isoform X2 [Pomacea canaliculata]|uniref:calphotin-like isoform X2 n=1 Tax=Pomacea canaliculata TaxID=400727 RepID=UPI000D738CD8|nr:calphotin-like isoform X2 [Pomacea canaliculata]